MGIRGFRHNQTSDRLMTAKDISRFWCYWGMQDRNANIIVPNIYFGSCEADVLELTPAGYLHEYEIKISRSDLFGDAQKVVKGNYHRTEDGLWRRERISKHQELQNGARVNTFNFVVPTGLISTEECPSWAGLIYASWYGDRIMFNQVKNPKRLSKEKLGTEKVIRQMYRSTYFRFHIYHLAKQYRK